MSGLRPLMGVLLIALLPGVGHAGLGPEYEHLASFGISIGGMRWLADSDAAKYPGDEHGPGGTAQMRPAGRAAFRYRYNSTWTMSLEAGFGWNGYADSDNLVLWAIPLTIGAERRVAEVMGASTSLCFGGGIYVWGLRRGGEFLIDAKTQHDYHAGDPGGYLGLHGEFPMSPVLTMFLQTTGNFIYSAHSDNFPDRFGGSDFYVDLRVGLNYYFSTTEGLIHRAPKEGAQQPDRHPRPAPEPDEEGGQP
jgi:hypothetical protein